MLKKLLYLYNNLNIKYNLLSLLNVLLGFSLFLLIAKEYGANKETDVYFSIMVISVYFGYFFSIFYEALSPYYAEFREQSQEILMPFISSLKVLILIVISIIIFIFILLSQLNHHFQLIEYTVFVNYGVIIVIIIISTHLTTLNKIILNLEHQYSLNYISDIVPNITQIISLLIFKSYLGIQPLLYAVIIGQLIILIIQEYVLFKNLNIRYKLKFETKLLLPVIKNGFFLKSGSFLYGLKDILIMNCLNSISSGTYSIYSYASKFSSAVFLITNAPLVQIFAANSQKFVAKKQYHNIIKSIKSILPKTVTMFIASSIIVYYLLPFIIVFINKESLLKGLNPLKAIFIYLTLYNFVIVLSSMFNRSLNAFKDFLFCAFENFIFISVFYLNILIINLFKLPYYWIFIALIFAEFFNSGLGFLRCNYLIKKHSESYIN
jgi:peptidoglycan biosynthesis protein MviN/MurJ (putative lipid II flippase)